MSLFWFVSFEIIVYQIVCIPYGPQDSCCILKVNKNYYLFFYFFLHCVHPKTGKMKLQRKKGTNSNNKTIKIIR